MLDKIEFGADSVGDAGRLRGKYRSVHRSSGPLVGM
jgi:hypothetical protein